MAAIIATLPRAGGNGAALVVVVADMFMRLFAAMTEKSAPLAKAEPKAETARFAKTASVWKMYSLAADSDSVSPKVATRLHNDFSC